jgi:acetylornithine/succinyldiaminopimelate/putrescine aminotransferase
MDLKAKYAFIKDARGRGLILGLELDSEGSQIVTRCMEEGFLINCTMGTILRFLPPLIITPGEVDQLVRTLDRIFGELTEGVTS